MAGEKVTIGGSREIMEEMIWQELTETEKLQLEIAKEYRVSRATIVRIKQKKEAEYGTKLKK